MEIRKAEPAEVDSLMELFEQARAFMAAHGNPGQWIDGYPQRELILEDIRDGRGYVCAEDGHLYAYFMLLEGDEPTYARIDGAWLDDKPYLTLHRVASTGERRGMMDFIVNWAKTKNPSLRGDTHENNLNMQRAFERNGFVRCGTIWISPSQPRVAYQLKANG